MIRPTILLVVLAASVPNVVACKRTPAQQSALRSPGSRSYTVHEWGLFALDIAADSHVTAASGSQCAGAHAVDGSADFGASDSTRGFGGLGLRGSGAGGGKPVVYVHLDDGADTARFSLGIGVSRASVREHFPSARVGDTRLEFGPIAVTRGRCASPTPPPDSTAPACSAVADHYCEAAEIPRYHGDDDTCLTTAGQSSEFLFYRAAGLDRSQLPLVLDRDGDSYSVRAQGERAVDGPLLFIERHPDGSVLYRSLTGADRAGPVSSVGGSASVSETRAVLTTHARQLGLTPAEADAFVDAWSPAFFDTPRRTGPDASGTAPRELGVAEVSLLYFAPRATVEAMLPMTTNPPAREVSRAFLVRVVDSSREAPAPGGLGTLGIGLGTLGRGAVNGIGSGVDSSTANPSVRFDLPNTSEGLGPDVVRRVISRHIAEVVYCYRLGLQRQADIAGNLGVTFMVARNGTVAVAAISTALDVDPEVGRCVVGRVRGWAFPTPEPAGNVRVTTVFHLAPPR